MATLLTPLRIGVIDAPNRVLMAPLTRCRAPNHVPTPLMAEYYAQRASAGLIIAEATMAMAGGSAFSNEPGIHLPEQIEGWRGVTSAVHQAGGRIFLQLWHGGRTCHPLLNDGRSPIAPSAIAITSNPFRSSSGPVPHALPRAIDDADIPDLIQGFAAATRNARNAGFDGVEIHGANGYLIDQFTRDGSNQREGAYGGPASNRIRFAREVVEAACAAWEPGRVGLRVSPIGSGNSMRDSDPIGTFSLLAHEVSQLGIAYLHVLRADSLGVQKADVLPPLRESFKGTLIANMAYSPDEADQAVRSGQMDAVAFGRAFLANPDLPERIQRRTELNTANEKTFYGGGAEGYTDYPFLSKAQRDAALLSTS
jgi:N-ethylmaleimide reductase